MSENWDFKFGQKTNINPKWTYTSDNSSKKNFAAKDAPSNGLSLRCHDINTELLKTISKALSHDFFIDYSNQMYGKSAQNYTENPPENV